VNPDHRPCRRALLSRLGCLCIVRQPALPPKPFPGQPGSGSTFLPDIPEIFVAIADDGRIFAFNGHVDLGTGIRTALTQIVAEELDVETAAVHMVMGDSAEVPNQGPTIASASIQISAVPLRQAAALARQALVELALALAMPPVGRDAPAPDSPARPFHADGMLPNAAPGADGEASASQGADQAVAQPASPQAKDFTTRDARVIAPNGQSWSYADLVAGQQICLPLDDKVPLKDPARYRIVGQSTKRVDLPAKATGGLTFVHDMRVPGMLHGRVVRPPYSGHDCGDFVGTSLLSVDTASVAHLPGVRDVVVIGDFIGVVAEREEQAIRAAQALSVQWKGLPKLPDLSDPAAAIQAADATPRLLQESGDVDAAAQAPDITTLTRTYSWPYQMHASIGPSCALADYPEAQDGRITVWSGTQNPQTLRHDLSVLIGRDEADIDIVRMEAAGCYGRNCADDVCGDALLLSRAVGAPVRVQLSRADEHLWEPKGCAQIMQVTGSVTADGRPFAYTFTNRYPSNDSPLLASLLTGVIPADPRVYFMGDRTAVTPYTFEHTRFTCEDLAPLVRSSWLRGVSAMPNSFAHDTFIDELAHIAHADPLAFRLQYLTDRRATDLLQAVGEKASWIDRTKSDALPRPHAADSRFKRGRGISYARYVHSRFPGFGAAWAAWYVDLEVDTQTGEIHVLQVIVGHDAGMMVNPDGVRHQVHGNIIQTLSRVLKERVRFVDGKVASREWGSYPMLTFAELPSVDVLLMARPGEPPLGAGESASVPGAAAIANALFDATGVRFYEPPFTPAVVRATLLAARTPARESGQTPTNRAVSSATKPTEADIAHVV